MNFSAVGGSIGTLVSVVEVLKTITPGFYQVNRFATISYQSVEEGGKSESQNQRLFPKLEVKLTLDKPSKTTEGFQDALTEDERKKLYDIHIKQREDRRNGRFRRRRVFRGRRGGFRGRRPFRGRRGGFRGRPPMRGRRIMRGRGRGRGLRGRGGRPPMNARGGNTPRGRGNQPRGRGNRNN